MMMLVAQVYVNEKMRVDPRWSGDDATTMKVHSRGLSDAVIRQNSTLVLAYNVLVLLLLANLVPVVQALDDKPIEEIGARAANLQVPRVCRENPDWPGSLHGTCSNATSWSPSTNLPSWIDEVDYWKNQFPYTYKIRGCLTEHLAERWASLREETRRDEEGEIPSPTMFWSEKDEHGDSVVFQLSDALSEHEALGVQVLARCVRDISSEHYERRSFGTGGGNDVTYMNFMLQKFLPGVASQLSSMIHMVHSAIGKMNNPTQFFPHPSTLGIRTTEHLSYREFPDGLSRHKDSGSVFTVLVFLSDPQDYEGGEFFVRFDELGMQTLSRPRRLSAMVFLSEVVNHGVNPIRSGLRETFATEFWVYSNVPSNHRRPDPAAWELYLERIQDNSSAPFPTGKETIEFVETGRSIWPRRVPTSSNYGESYSASEGDADAKLGEGPGGDGIVKKGGADDPIMAALGDEL